MTTPQHPRPVEDVDDDPTGMSALLRGLPDPGPMPDELVRRIQVSLAAQTGPFARTDGDAEVGYAPVHDLSRRRSTLRPMHWAAAAGIIAVAGGGLLMTQGDGLMSALSVGDTSAAGGAPSMSVAAGSGREALTSPDLTTSDTAVVMSNRAWTTADLAAAGAAALGSGSTLRPLASENPGIGPIGTPIGARDCASALGIPSDADVVLDLVSVDEEPAAVVVATTGSAQTAYLVRRNCRTGSPELIAGPQRF